MDDCPSCDFCEVMPDGTLFCAIREVQVHHGETCDNYDRDVFIAVRKDNWFGFKGKGKSKDKVRFSAKHD